MIRYICQGLLMPDGCADRGLCGKNCGHAVPHLPIFGCHDESGNCHHMKNILCVKYRGNEKIYGEEVKNGQT